MKRTARTFFSFLAPLVASIAAVAAPTLTELKVYPADVNLKTRQDRQAIVVQATFADGVTRDVTSEASLTLADKSRAQLDRATLLPLSDGATELRVKFQGKAVAVPVKVEKAFEDQAISFTHDVMPIFTKAGCNMGGCHGKAEGKAGFKLSVFGFDPFAFVAGTLVLLAVAIVACVVPMLRATGVDPAIAVRAD